ncbi:hypothetical protein CLOACE_09380 [Clostridium acetireducens DSM 10703]|jgi:hypothetical protein|uniref:2',5' RNA ligase family n=1 Tax=Clostridium acetireducens DSM 10703 TaxID=1121290 RepID=A0A1E8EZM9_9CLOT|nr:hypothetical protein [Clostridium acetireducens]OFI06596.1 hypothetical protein CLOACE_09380 [Clostridium acetireducens DSM 10703]
MKYYLVALFDKNSYAYIKNVQRDLCKKYKFYKNPLGFHVTLSVIEDPDIDKLSLIINDIIKPYKKFKVGINLNCCLNNNQKYIGLPVKNKGYIATITRNINEDLLLKGFNFKNSNIDNLFIPLCYSGYNNSKGYNLKYSDEENLFMVKVDRIELWKSINSRKEIMVKRFTLRDF